MFQCKTWSIYCQNVSHALWCWGWVCSCGRGMISSVFRNHCNDPAMRCFRLCLLWNNESSRVSMEDVIYPLSECQPCTLRRRMSLFLWPRPPRNLWLTRRRDATRELFFPRDRSVSRKNSPKNDVSPNQRNLDLCRSFPIYCTSIRGSQRRASFLARMPENIIPVHPIMNVFHETRKLDLFWLFLTK